MTLRALFVVALLLAGAGCGRIEELRLAHANDGTRAEWPPGVLRLETRLLAPETGQPWVGVSVDGNPPVPFLLSNSAGAVAVTGARMPRALAGPVGRMTAVGELLPGVGGGQLVHNRHLALEAVVLLDQSLLVVEEADWPYGRPGGGSAGVLGHDLFRRFAVGIDRQAQRAWFMRPENVEVTLHEPVLRLALLDRRPYVELELLDGGPGPWVRMQVELGWPGDACLDAPPETPSRVIVADVEVPVSASPCAAPVPAADPVAGRDGVLGYGAFQGRRLLVDYAGGRLLFPPNP